MLCVQAETRKYERKIHKIQSHMQVYITHKCVCVSRDLYVIRFIVEIRNWGCSFNSEWGRLSPLCLEHLVRSCALQSLTALSSHSLTQI